MRIDVPLQNTYAMLFIDADQFSWDPWWKSLYEFLLAMAPSPLNWEYESVQGMYVARADLSDEKKGQLVEFLRTAPTREIAEHRTLQRAVKLISEQVKRIRLLYFAAGKDGPV